nr:hypothetical protein BaRGS_024416 [Batillaria attramentaria]
MGCEDVQEDTDKDSGDEDEEGTISNLNRCQLQALATATVRRHGEKQSYDMEESADTPLFSLSRFRCLNTIIIIQDIIIIMFVVVVVSVNIVIIIEVIIIIVVAFVIIVITIVLLIVVVVAMVVVIIIIVVAVDSLCPP